MAEIWERPAIANHPISVLIIAGSDSQQLAKVVDALAGDLAELKREHELLIADAGASDEVRATATALAGKHRHTRVVAVEGAVEGEPGYGAALKAGIAVARFPLLFTIAADGGYQSTFLHHLLTMIDQVDIVACVRPNRSGFRHWKNRLLARLAYGLALRDPSCPVRLYRRSVFERVPIQSATRFAEVEILAKTNFTGCLMTEIPIQWPMPDAVASGPSLWEDAKRIFRNPKFNPPKEMAVA